MADVRDLLVRIKGDTGDFERSMGKVSDSSDKGNLSFMKLTGAVAAGQAIFSATSAAIHTAVDFLGDSVKEYQQAEASQKELENAVINVTHGTKEQLKATNDLADSLSRKGVLDDDVIRKGLAQLSTFGLTNDSVQKLGKSMADLTVNQFGVKASGDQAVTSANIMAKALNGNFGALEKMGIHLTEAQKHMIKFGDETQRVSTINEVMAANLRTNQATALETTEGKLAHLSVAYGNVKESIGGVVVSALNPLMTSLSNFVSSDKFQDWVAKVTPIIKKDLTEAMNFLAKDVLPKLLAAFKFIVAVGKELIDFYEHHRKLVNFIAEAIMALVAAFVIMNTVMGIVNGLMAAFNLIAALNPMVLIIAAIIALILLMITHWDTVKKWISDFWGWIKNVFGDIVDFIKKHWDLLLDILLGPIGFVIGELIKHWDTIKKGFTDVVDWIKSVFHKGWDFVVGIWNGLTDVFSKVFDGVKGAFGKVFDIITSPFKTAFNAVAKFWNDTMGKIDFHLPDWVPGVGGKGFKLPSIPLLAEGGIIDAPTLAVLGEGSSPEAVIPLDKLGTMLGGANPANKSQPSVSIDLDVNIGMYAGMPVEKRQIAEELWRELVRSARAQGVQLPQIGSVGVQ